MRRQPRRETPVRTAKSRQFGPGVNAALDAVQGVPIAAHALPSAIGLAEAGWGPPPSDCGLSAPGGDGSAHGIAVATSPPAAGMVVAARPLAQHANLHKGSMSLVKRIQDATLQRLLKCPKLLERFPHLTAPLRTVSRSPHQPRAGGPEVHAPEDVLLG